MSIRLELHKAYETERAVKDLNELCKSIPERQRSTPAHEPEGDTQRDVPHPIYSPQDSYLSGPFDIESCEASFYMSPDSSFFF